MICATPRLSWQILMPLTSVWGWRLKEVKGYFDTFELKHDNYTLTCRRMMLFWVHDRPREPLQPPGCLCKYQFHIKRCLDGETRRWKVGLMLLCNNTKNTHSFATTRHYVGPMSGHMSHGNPQAALANTGATYNKLGVEEYGDGRLD